VLLLPAGVEQAEVGFGGALAASQRTFKKQLEEPLNYSSGFPGDRLAPFEPQVARLPVQPRKFLGCTAEKRRV
jgi:hypothetical protein